MNSKPGWKPWLPPPKRRKPWPGWTGFRGMTLRDWLPIVGALLIPVVVAAGTWGITWQQGKIEDQRAEAERELAKQRAQDEALQTYLDQMGTLMLEKDLRNSDEDSEVRTLARARTLTVLSRLDPDRKGDVMQFLIEANLVQGVGRTEPIIRLGGANLSEVKLSYTDMSGANLSEADLTETDMSYADLGGANLNETDMSYADLYRADLSEADLTETDMSGADLSQTDMSEAELRLADLSTAVSKADRRYRYSYTVLLGADLSHADLSAAKGITNEKLNQQAVSLKGATMPNGQKYEDWLKDREKR